MPERDDSESRFLPCATAVEEPLGEEVQQIAGDGLEFDLRRGAAGGARRWT